MVALISLVLVPAIAVVAGAMNRYTEQVRMAGLARALQSGIAREEATMADAARSISGDIVARKLTGATSTDAILPVLEADQKNTSATGVVFVGNNGVVVARTHAPQEWGDYIYETTAYGQVMAQGHDFASVETGSIYPLVINAGHVITSASGTPIAGVIAGRWFNDGYVQEMRDAYLGVGGDQLVVYSNHFGEVGSSFSSAADRAQTARLFNAGSDLVRGNIGDAIIPVTIGGNEYIAGRVLFDGVGKSNGGAFILVPYNYVGSAVALSALLVAIVWLVLFARLSYRQSFFSKVIDGALLGVGAVIVFLISFHANVITFKYATPVIDQYPLESVAGDSVVIRGHATSGESIFLTLVKQGGQPVVESVSTTPDGTFALLWPAALDQGTYQLSAYAVDARGAQSNPTAPLRLAVSSQVWLGILTSWLTYGSLFVFLALFVLGALFVVVSLTRRLNQFRRTVTAEKKDAEDVLHMMLIRLATHVRNHIDILETTKSKRLLSDEEDALIKDLRKDITDIEKKIGKTLDEQDMQGK